MAASALLRQKAFRHRNDDGDEASATWALTLNTDPVSAVQPGTGFRVRFAIEEYAGKAISSAFDLIGRVNGGTWYQLGDANMPLALIDSTYITGIPATTQQISAPDSFTAGELYELGSTGSVISVGKNTTSEFEFCFELPTSKYNSVYTDDDLIEFAVARANLGLLDDYAVTPSFTIGALTQFSNIYRGGVQINEFALNGSLIPNIFYGSKEVFRNN